MTDNHPRVSASELLRALRRDGWEIVRQSGSHVILRHETKPGRVEVPQHSGGKTLKIATLRSILQQAGLSGDDLRRLL